MNDDYYGGFEDGYDSYVTDHLSDAEREKKRKEYIDRVNKNHEEARKRAYKTFKNVYIKGEL